MDTDLTDILRELEDARRAIRHAGIALAVSLVVLIALFIVATTAPRLWKFAIIAGIGCTPWLALLFVHRAKLRRTKRKHEDYLNGLL